MPVHDPVHPDPSVSKATRVGSSVRPLVLSELSLNSTPQAPLVLDPVQALSASQGLNPLHQVKATLTICVGHAEVTIGELLGAREQQVLQLDHGVDQPVDILLEGQVVARGLLVAVGDRFGVQITELPIPLKP